MKIVQINTSVNTGSTGRIAEQIGYKAIENGYSSTIAYGISGKGKSRSSLINIGSKSDRLLHGLKTRLFDLHGFGSKKATLRLIKELEELNPDVIGMHNLHGYYLNVEMLFDYLKKVQKPVVWTFHDCWPFTGHCTYFDSVGCTKWIDGCFNCPKTRYYPASYGFDNSKWNYKKKMELFNGVDNLMIVTPSHWLADLVKQSFLKKYPVNVIHNGVDTEVFKPATGELPSGIEFDGRKVVLGVASVWDERKGLEDFIELNKRLDDEYQMILVGLNKKQLSNLPSGITGIYRTENVHQLAALYGAANIFVNPTWQDNFPTTNIEALACGTPVITYNTGGSPEAVDESTGFVVQKGDLDGIVQSLKEVSEKSREKYREQCRKRAVANYNKEDRFQDYIELYESMLA